jgi:hypothetical protein
MRPKEIRQSTLSTVGMPVVESLLLTRRPKTERPSGGVVGIGQIRGTVLAVKLQKIRQRDGY